MKELIGIAYSPWTEKARWSLEFHRIPFRYREHTLMLGMPYLRLKMRKLHGDLTVPALVDGSNRLMDSLEIAKYADRLSPGGRGQLFPADHMAEIERYNQLSEDALDAIRALVVGRVLRDREAQIENFPSFIPRFLRPFLRFMVKLGVGYLDREFGVRRRSEEENRKRVRDALFALRSGLAASKGVYLLGRFSFADIAMAAVVQGVAPVSDAYLSLHPAVRRCWTDEELKREFKDLIDWRDRIYATHRIQ